MCSDKTFHMHQASREPRKVRANGKLAPAFRLFGGAIETLPGGPQAPEVAQALKALKAHRAEVEQAARSVGRIHQGPVTLGTGFVIGPNVIMTARHVAQSFATDVDDVLKIRIGWTPAIDFVAEEPPPFTGPDTAHEPAPDSTTWRASATGRGKPAINVRAETMTEDHLDGYHQQPKGVANACYPIRSILYDNEEFDIALLLVPFASTLQQASAAERETVMLTAPRFEPLTLTLASDSVAAERRDVCVIGCPDDDPFATDNERNQVFKNVFDVKRVQPGRVNRVLMDDAMVGHTCSTLRGNSGSPVIDLEKNEVIGLHVRGSRELPGQPALNEATALWLLPAEVRDVLKRARDIYAWKEEPVGSV